MCLENIHPICCGIHLQHADLGIPPRVMQEILGHKSITMTLDIYSYVLPDKKAEEINKMAAMF